MIQPEVWEIPSSSGDEDDDDDRNSPPETVAAAAEVVPDNGPTADKVVTKAQKARILNSIIPYSLMPAASATGFLIFGSNSAHCFFYLKGFMVVAGAVCLAAPVTGSVFKRMFDLMMAADEDDEISAAQAGVLNLLRHAALGVVVMEVCLLAVGSVLVVPNLMYWQYSDVAQEGTYCDFGLMTFALAVLSTCWVLILSGFLMYLFIFYFDPDQKARKAVEEEEAMVEEESP